MQGEFQWFLELLIATKKYREYYNCGKYAKDVVSYRMKHLFPFASHARSGPVRLKLNAAFLMEFMLIHTISV